MSTSIIDLPENLQPATYLQSRDLEQRLTDRSRTVVEFCREVWNKGRWEAISQAEIKQLIREAQDLWSRNGEQVGPAVAFLWLAEWYWRNGMLESVCKCCEKAIEHLPNAQLPAYTLPKAAARYMLGLSHHMSDRLSQALYSYQEALESFKATQAYWRRVGDKQAETSDEILGWISRLIRYVSYVRLYPPGIDQEVLICACRSNAVKKGAYLLAEIELTQSITAQNVPAAKANLLSQQGRAWRWMEGEKGIGYKVGTHLRILGQDNVPQPFSLRLLNRNMKIGTDRLLPAGATYYALPTGGQLTLSGKVGAGDYVLARSTDSPDPDQLVLLRHKGDDDVAMGVFERDAAGNVSLKEVFKPERVIGEPETNFVRLGSIDFVLHPA